MRQVLELASGLSLRGFSMAQNQDIAYVETALKGLTNEKRILVSTLKQKYSLATNGNFHLTTANALDEHQLESAIQHFHKDQPVAHFNEGLFPYLTASEIALGRTKYQKLFSHNLAGFDHTGFFFKGKLQSCLRSTHSCSRCDCRTYGRQLS